MTSGTDDPYAGLVRTDVPQIVAADCQPDSLVIRFDGHAEPERYGWLWLRDHDENDASLDAATLQRKVDTFRLVDDVVGTAVSISDGTSISVSWSDGSPTGVMSARTLATVAGLFDPLPRRRPWTRATIIDPLPSVTAAAALTDDSAVVQWLTNVRIHGFGLVRELEPTAAAAAALARRVAYPRDTIFGAMWTLSSEVRAHDDSAYSTSYLEPHTDGTYAIDAPGLQMFCCVEREGSGGESTLVDGLQVAESIRADDSEAFEVLTTVSVPGRYVEEGVHLMASRPPIHLDANGGIVQVSLNNYDRAPMRLPRAEMAEFYRAYGLLHARANDPANRIEIRLEPGDALLFDNWRTLHGRMSYIGRRVFEGCYHNYEDFISRLVTLAG